MNIVQGKCPNCGASIKVDQDTDAAICEYCGSAYVTEKAIVNFGTYIKKQEIHNVKQDNEWTYKIEQEHRKDELSPHQAMAYIAGIVLFLTFLLFACKFAGMY